MRLVGAVQYQDWRFPLDSKFNADETRQLLEIAMCHADRELVGLALSAALALPDAGRTLLADAIERAAAADLSGFFGLARRYGQLDLVLGALNDPRARVREVVAATLRWIHDERVVVPLERAIEDPDPGVRSAAASSLQSMKEEGANTFSPLALEAVRHPHPSLIRLLLDHNPTPKELPEILAALDNTGIPAKLRAAIAFKAVPIFAAFPESLVELLWQRTEWPSVELLAALGKLGDRRVVPCLLRYTDSFEWNSPSALCYALAEIGGDDAARALTRLLVAHKSWAAPAALKRMGRAAAPYVLEAYGESPLVRQQHAELLAAVAGEDALPALITALHDTDNSVRVNAELGLCALGEAAVEPLLALVGSRYFMARPHAINVLARIGGKRALRQILEIASDATDECRFVALEALGGFDAAEAVEFLEASLYSSDPEVRRKTVYTLAASANPDLHALLLRAAGGRITPVRIASFSGLAMLARYKGDQNSVAVLASATADPNPDVADAAGRALVEVGYGAIAQIEAYMNRGAQRDPARLLGILERLSAQPQPSAVFRDSASEPTAQPPQMSEPLPSTLGGAGAAKDQVRFSVVAPMFIAPGKSFLIDLWAHLEELTDEVIMRSREARGHEEFRLATKGPVKLARDTVLRARLSIPTMGVNDEDTIIWMGRLGNTSFPVTVPAETAPGTHLACFNLFVGPLRISRLHFDLTVTARAFYSTPLRHRLRENRVRSAFASYASDDRDEVMARLQGMMKVLPDLDVFLDVLSLRSGDLWQQRIREEVSIRDVFYLFWSHAARNSRWVETEWRTALNIRGLEYIDPVPLQPASVAPPPPELAALHFNEWTLSFRAGDALG